MLKGMPVELHQRYKGAAVQAQYIFEEVASVLRVLLFLHHITLGCWLLAARYLDVHRLLKVPFKEIWVEFA